MVYFQGISVKGISGSPIISRDTGKVIAIVTTKLIGISTALDQIGETMASGRYSMKIISGSGVELGQTVGNTITTLRDQLANGLGGGTGAADAGYAVKKAQRYYKPPK